jgi:RND family efflux transporter MFP subunit
VRRGQLLARIESSEQESGRESAVADRESARSELATAGWNLEQAEELFRAGAIPERDLKAAQQAVVAARARVAAADSRVRATSSDLADTYVRAPSDGVVERRTVQTGEHVARGGSLFTVVRTDVLELAASVPARHAVEVAAGQRVRFVAGGRAVEGRVARVSPTIDPASRAVTVYVQIPNADGSLKGGTFASGAVIGHVERDALVVASAAVRQGQEGAPPFVYRIEAQRLAQVPVRLGIVDDRQGLTQLLDGLADGDRVVAGNVGTLGDGMRVDVIGEDAGSGKREGGTATPSAAGKAP